MKYFKATLFFLGLSVNALAGPIGPPGGSPILNQGYHQIDSQFNTSTGTVTSNFVLPYLVPGLCTTTDSSGRVINIPCGGSGGGGSFNGVILRDALSNKWNTSITTSGNLITAPSSFFPTGFLNINPLVLADPCLNYWRVTVDTTSHLVTTSSGSYNTSIDKFSLIDTSSNTWLLTVSTTGALITSGNGYVPPAVSCPGASGGGTPGGSNNNIQFNNAGSFGGSNSFQWSGSSVTVPAIGPGVGDLEPINGGIGIRSPQDIYIEALSSSSLVVGKNSRLAFVATSGLGREYIVAASTLAISGEQLSFVLPNSSGTAGQFIQTDGAGNLSFATASGGSTSPASPLNSVQFNSTGTFNGSANFTTDGSSVTVSTAVINRVLNMVAGSTIVTNGSQPSYFQNNSGNSWIFSGPPDNTGNQKLTITPTSLWFKDDVAGLPPVMAIGFGAAPHSGGPSISGSNGVSNLCSDLSSVCISNPIALYDTGGIVGAITFDGTGKLRLGSSIAQKYALLAVGGSAVIGSGYSDIAAPPTNGLVVTGSEIVLSSMSVLGSGGLGVTYGVNVGSMTGAGLTSCSGSSNAVSWNSSTNLFGCNTISGGGGGSSTLAVTTGSTTGWTGNPVSSPTAVVLFDSTTFKVSLQGGSTAYIASISTITASSLGALTANQTITLSGDSTGSGATSIAVTAAATQANIKTFTSSVTFTSSNGILANGGPVTPNQGLNFSGINTVTANYTAKSTDTFILADGTSGAMTVTLPAASALKGQLLYIQKKDTSLNAISIKPAGTDVIVSTGLWTLNAQGQGIKLLSDGSATWWAPDGLHPTPIMVGSWPNAKAANIAGVANQAWIMGTTIEDFVQVGSCTVNIGTSANNLDVGIYDSAGTRLGSNGGIASPGTGQRAISFSGAPINLVPGQYYLALSANGTSIAFTGMNANASLTSMTFASSYPLPTSLTLGSGTSAATAPWISCNTTGGATK